MEISSKYWGLIAGGLSIVLWVLSIPPFECAEAAYIAFIPLLLWLYTNPNKPWVVGVGLGVGWLAWFAILIWLRHVTWFGTIALSGFLGSFFMLWLLAAWKLIPELSSKNVFLRVLGFGGIAGMWVVLEWTRSWFLWGFPWAPLSLSQWERPVVLQIAAWTGAYGVSFLLVFFNLCVAQTLRHRFGEKASKIRVVIFSPDLYIAMCGLGLSIYVFFLSLPSPNTAKEMFTAGVVQPYIPPSLKWDTDREFENLEILERQTRFVGSLDCDLILWPEAATPWPIIGSAHMQLRVERLVDEIGKPILMGGLAEDTDTEAWSNGAFLVEPKSGLSLQSYAKRELVPFGEYVPRPFGFIDKVVPIGGSFIPGEDVGLIDLKIAERTFRVSPLICYEDVFPALAREGAQAGADIFFVATNNAWYGEEGGAEQHAAHSVLRAVENRRPVIRAGNAGWSGWIDSHGTIREVLTDANASVYFRGGGSYDVFEFTDWERQQSYYTRNGDWFIGLCGALALISYLLVFGLRHPFGTTGR